MISIYIRSICPYCVRLISLLDKKNISYKHIEITEENRAEEMFGLSGERGVPQVHVGDIIMPDYDTEESLIKDTLWLQKNPNATAEEIQKHTTSKIIHTSC